MPFDPSFWIEKKVLVTGADGFMGSHLTERLLDLNANVAIYIRGNSLTGTVTYKLKNLGHRKGRFRTILTGDIGSHDSIELICRDRPEYIFHLAADAYVPNSFQHPIEVMETNLLGTLNVLEAAKKIEGFKQVVCTSSSEIYGTHPMPINEGMPMNPTSPYGASKAAADRFCYSYWNTYHIPVSIIRPFNTYGPRHTYDVIPKFISLALRGEPLTVHGDGKQTRDFTYVSDTVEAFLIMAGDPNAIGKAVNFGTGQDTCIIEVAEKIVRLAGGRSKIQHTPVRTSEVQRLCCDPSLARSLFGWNTKVDLDEGLKRNIDWARKNLQS